MVLFGQDVSKETPVTSPGVFANLHYTMAGQCRRPEEHEGDVRAG
jgi:hypothetical protein